MEREILFIKNLIFQSGYKFNENIRLSFVKSVNMIKIKSFIEKSAIAVLCLWTRQEIWNNL